MQNNIKHFSQIFVVTDAVTHVRLHLTDIQQCLMMMRLSEDHSFPLKLEVPNPHALFCIKKKDQNYENTPSCVSFSS